MSETIDSFVYPIRLHEAAPIGQALRFHVTKYWEDLESDRRSILLATADAVMSRRDQAQVSVIPVNEVEQLGLGDYSAMLHEYAGGLLVGDTSPIEFNAEIEASFALQLASRMENAEGHLGE